MNAPSVARAASGARSSRNRARIRSRSSAAAFSVNVIVRIAPTSTPSSSTERTKRSTSTDVLPLPAAASSSRSPCRRSIARRCSCGPLAAPAPRCATMLIGCGRSRDRRSRPASRSADRASPRRRAAARASSTARSAAPASSPSSSAGAAHVLRVDLRAERHPVADTLRGPEVLAAQRLVDAGHRVERRAGHARRACRARPGAGGRAPSGRPASSPAARRSCSPGRSRGHRRPSLPGCWARAPRRRGRRPRARGPRPRPSPSTSGGSELPSSDSKPNRISSACGRPAAASSGLVVQVAPHVGLDPRSAPARTTSGTPEASPPPACASAGRSAGRASARARSRFPAVTGPPSSAQQRARAPRG